MIENEFLALRPQLLALAYRMLGSVADSEDVVQNAWLRFAKSGDAEIEFPKAYFRKIVTRLCLDQLKSARHKREQYIGTWLPEPVDTGSETSFINVENDIDISYAIMLTLEQLSPLERAAYLLHDLFEMGFAEIAEILERDVATCRKLASRARSHLAKREKRFAATEQAFERLINAFLHATKTGDVSGLTAQLADDIKYYSDGGGKVIAALNIISGANSVARMLLNLAVKHRFSENMTLRMRSINGQMALTFINEHDDLQPFCFDLNDKGEIANFYTMRNPDKLVILGQRKGSPKLT